MQKISAKNGEEEIQVQFVASVQRQLREQIMAFNQSRKREALGVHPFCVACPNPIGPNQRVREVNGMPVHLACYRRLVRETELRNARITSVQQVLGKIFARHD